VDKVGKERMEEAEERSEREGKEGERKGKEGKGKAQHLLSREVARAREVGADITSEERTFNLLYFIVFISYCIYFISYCIISYCIYFILYFEPSLYTIDMSQLHYDDIEQ